MCGEAEVVKSNPYMPTGPSPRVRGSPGGNPVGLVAGGSIPACAGKPDSLLAENVREKVHPRVCGEAARGGSAQGCGAGPSPRVRGSRADVGPRERPEGSIPACAGKPPSRSGPKTESRVHPRVCGEAAVSDVDADQSGGPSPRVRGSRIGPVALSSPLRSIPACAGKPRRVPVWLPACWVHPRVCGEAAPLPSRDVHLAGPSPRVRGSPRLTGPPEPEVGSIPACAGKPWPGPGRRRRTRVHPRVCGEAAVESFVDDDEERPSPRVRGSPPAPPSASAPAGSIPACAGKPMPRYSVRHDVWGPSPRVRGSHLPPSPS